MTLSFRVHGMDCAEEVGLLRQELAPLVGGEEQLAFDLMRARLTVRGVDLDEDALLEAISRAGLRAERWSDHPSESSDEERRRGRRSNALTLASGLLTGLGLGAHVLSVGWPWGAAGGPGADSAAPWIARLFYLAAIALGGALVVPRAWSSARRLRPDMHVLMTIAVIGAILIDEWSEGAVVTFLFALSLKLESWSVARARRAVRSLMELAPERARVRRGGDEVDVPVEDVAVGSAVIVHAGERIPLDGRVERGTSDVDQAPITGESVPVTKAPGSEVYAGSVNGDGVLEIETTRTADQSAPARIVRLVADAQERRAPSERWVDRFARVYTPVVLGAAALMFLLPPLLAGGDWQTWFYRSLVLLVISCPCALVISTPVSIVAALTAAARNGVLVKGGVHLEAVARLRAVAFDKTGTLTRGAPAVTLVVPIWEHDERELLERAAALEARSDHPLARAIVERARAAGLEPDPAEDVELVQGKGLRGRVAGTRYWMGSHRLLEETGQETPEIHERLVELARGGRTVVVVGNDRHVCGFLALADEVRPEAKPTLARLRRMGLGPLVMLTGDNEDTAVAIAREAGIDEHHAELLPEDKVRWIADLEARDGSLAMVGDGINDAPALARASLGIAMGAVGSDAAIETADIALMSDELGKLPALVAHSRRTLRIVRQNVVFSLAVKLLVLLLAGVGLAGLWLAIAADTGASMLVIFNGLRLLKMSGEGSDGAS